MAIYIDNQVVTKQKLYEILNIPERSIPFPREKRFQLPTRTDGDGNSRHLHRLMCNEFSVYLPKENREVRVRLATTQKKDKEQNFEYFPTDNALESGEKGLVVINDEMTYLFWYINPMNRQSIFRKPHGPVFYEFLDNDSLAKASNDKDEIRITAMSIILGQNAWPVSRLRTLAKGIGVGGVNDMTDEVVKNTLKGKAYADPLTFINQAESREVAFAGKIQEAIDGHIIQLRTVNGMQRWYLNGSEIIPVQYGIDARKVLDDHLSAKWYMYSDEITNSLTNVSVSSNLNSAQNDAAFTETEVAPVVIDAELWSAYQELKKDERKMEKVMKYLDVDITNPGLNVNARAAAKRMQEEIALYKKGLALETAQG